MESPTVEGQWVCWDRGTRIPKDQCPPDAKLAYMVDYVTYDSPEEYAQIQENKRLQGIASKARFDANPDGYPPCAGDPPVGPESTCGYESCDMHNILWLEYDGCNHEQAIGLTAVYNFSDSWGYGLVADTLGGMEEFNNLNDGGPDVPKMIEWYTAHQPLVEYILETRERDGLYEYWWSAKVPGRGIPKFEEMEMMLVKDDNGQWGPYQIPGQQLVAPKGFGDWLEFIESDPLHDHPGYWDTHTLGRFKYQSQGR